MGIAAHNADPQWTYTLAVNKFADLPHPVNSLPSSPREPDLTPSSHLGPLFVMSLVTSQSQTSRPRKTGVPRSRPLLPHPRTKVAAAHVGLSPQRRLSSHTSQSKLAN